MKTKKISKKLSLSKTTISNLNNLVLKNAKGGATAWRCPTYPEVCDTYTDCDTTAWWLCTDSEC